MKSLSLVFTAFVFLNLLVFVPQIASADFSPAQIPDLQLWINASNGVTTDGTIPAVIGNNVEQWNDQSGYGENFSQSTVGLQPVLSQDEFGKNYVSFIGNKNLTTSVSLLPFSLGYGYTGPYLVGASWRDTFVDSLASEVLDNTLNYTDYDDLVITAVSNSFPNFEILNPYAIGFSPISNYFNKVPLDVIHTSREFYVSTVYSYDNITGSTTEMDMFYALQPYHQSFMQTFHKTTIQNSDGNISFWQANFLGAGYVSTAGVRELFVATSSNADNVINSASNYLNSSMPSYSPFVVFIGDSLTFGYGLDASSSFPSLIFDGNNPPNADYINAGITGFTTQREVDNDLASWDRFFRPGVANIAVIWLGTNDPALLNPPTEAVVTQELNNLQTTVNYFHGIGYKTIILPIIPRAEPTFQPPGLFNSLVAQINAGIPSVGSDVFVNLNTLSEFSSASTSWQDMTYYQSDQLHLTTAGQQVVADAVGPAIENIINPVVTPSVTTSAVLSITASSATLSGQITATGGADAMDSGFAYGIDSALVSNVSTSTIGAQTGTASLNLPVSSLICNTTYYVRAYAANSAGTGYGPVTPFTTSACSVPAAAIPALAVHIYGQSSHPPVFTTTSATVSNVSEPTAQNVFVRNLTQNSAGGDVMSLQKFLNHSGFSVASNGAGSLGNETDFFGPATKAALIKFQKTYDITPAVGYFGPETRYIIGVIQAVRASLGK